MDIFEKINAASNSSRYKILDSNKHMITLSSGEYDFIYRELKHKNNFQYTDLEGRVNFLIRISTIKDVETVVKNRKTVSVLRELEGPGIELGIEGLANRFIFTFDLNNQVHLYNLKKLLKNREAYMHFLLWNENNLINCFTALLEIDQRILERLIHMLQLTNSGEYPRINFQGYNALNCVYFVFDYAEGLLEELLDTVDILQKWGSKDIFSVYIDFEQGYKVIIDGNAQNKDYLKKELTKKYTLIEEGNCKPSGKPFFKYDKGMLYYYNSN